MLVIFILQQFQSSLRRVILPWDRKKEGSEQARALGLQPPLPQAGSPAEGPQGAIRAQDTSHGEFIVDTGLPASGGKVKIASPAEGCFPIIVLLAFPTSLQMSSLCCSCLQLGCDRGSVVFAVAQVNPCTHFAPERTPELASFLGNRHTLTCVLCPGHRTNGFETSPAETRD